MRLIDADLLEEADFSECLDSMEFMAIIDSQPTVEEKKGEWDDDSFSSACGITFVKFTCTCCNMPSGSQSKYCPNCGAKMKGV